MDGEQEGKSECQADVELMLTEKCEMCIAFIVGVLRASETKYQCITEGIRGIKGDVYRNMQTSTACVYQTMRAVPPTALEDIVRLRPLSDSQDS
jgi:hypothetical protein